MRRKMRRMRGPAPSRLSNRASSAGSPRRPARGVTPVSRMAMEVPVVRGNAARDVSKCHAQGIRSNRRLERGSRSRNPLGPSRFDLDEAEVEERPGELDDRPDPRADERAGEQPHPPGVGGAEREIERRSEEEQGERE